MQPSGDETRGLERVGHDHLFKQLLQAFFADFVRLFDPESAVALDLSTISFRDTETFTDIPQGERRLADVVARVATIDGRDALILMHTEMQRDRAVEFPQRMWHYSSLLRRRGNLPALPIALVLYPGRDGIAPEVYEDVTLGRTSVTFRYLQISLPRLEATAFVQAESVRGAGLARALHVPGARSPDCRASGRPAAGASGPDRGRDRRRAGVPVGQSDRRVRAVERANALSYGYNCSRRAIRRWKRLNAPGRIRSTKKAQRRGCVR